MRKCLALLLAIALTGCAFFRKESVFEGKTFTGFWSQSPGGMTYRETVERVANELISLKKSFPDDFAGFMSARQSIVFALNDAGQVKALTFSFSGKNQSFFSAEFRELTRVPWPESKEPLSAAEIKRGNNIGFAGRFGQLVTTMKASNPVLLAEAKKILSANGFIEDDSVLAPWENDYWLASD